MGQDVCELILADVRAIRMDLAKMEEGYASIEAHITAIERETRRLELADGE